MRDVVSYDGGGVSRTQGLTLFEIFLVLLLLRSVGIVNPLEVASEEVREILLQYPELSLLPRWSLTSVRPSAIVREWRNGTRWRKSHRGEESCHSDRPGRGPFGGRPSRPRNPKSQNF